MKFEITSKAYKVFLWLLVTVSTLLDVMAYAVVIIPGLIDFSLFDHTVFAVWFASKVLVIFMLSLNRGPIKYAIFLALTPLILTGIYCSLVYPFTSDSGFSNASLGYIGLSIAGMLMVYSTNRCVAHGT